MKRASEWREAKSGCAARILDAREARGARLVEPGEGFVRAPEQGAGTGGVVGAIAGRLGKAGGLLVRDERFLEATAAVQRVTEEVPRARVRRLALADESEHARRAFQIAGAHQRLPALQGRLVLDGWGGLTEREQQDNGDHGRVPFRARVRVSMHPILPRAASRWRA